MALLIDKIKTVDSLLVIAEFEKELATLQSEKEYLLSKKSLEKPKAETNNKVSKSKKLPASLIKEHNPTKKARLFEMLFAQTPTYDDILERSVVLNPQFRLAPDPVVSGQTLS